MRRGRTPVNASRFEYKGAMYTASELVNFAPSGMTPKRIYDRIHDGWSVENAVEKPLDHTRTGRQKRRTEAPQEFTELEGAEQTRLTAVNTIAQGVISGDLYAFDLQIITPMLKYQFSGEGILIYSIEFSREQCPCTATLTARYRRSGASSSLHREYKVHGMFVEEVMTE